jgi:hypothetical protein
LKIEFTKIDTKIYAFSVDCEEIGVLYSHIDKNGQNNWMAVDNFDGLSCEGTTKKEAVENLCIQRTLDEAQEELAQELFG